VRVVRAADGTIALDPTGRRPGRGAYLCRDASCWEVAARKRALDHALKAPVPDALLASLAADPAVAAVTTESTQRASTGAQNIDNHEGGPHGSK